MDTNDIYRRFLDGETTLEDAAQLLRTHAPAWRGEPGSLGLDTLPREQREKAAELLEAVTRPILDPYFAGEVASDVTARQLAPLVRPIGVWALSLNAPPGPRANGAMARLIELMNRLAGLETENDELQ